MVRLDARRSVIEVWSNSLMSGRDGGVIKCKIIADLPASLLRKCVPSYIFFIYTKNVNFTILFPIISLAGTLLYRLANSSCHIWVPFHMYIHSTSTFANYNRICRNAIVLKSPRWFSIGTSSKVLWTALLASLLDVVYICTWIIIQFTVVNWSHRF